MHINVVVLYLSYGYEIWIQPHMCGHMVKLHAYMQGRRQGGQLLLLACLLVSSAVGHGHDNLPQSEKFSDFFFEVGEKSKKIVLAQQ